MTIPIFLVEVSSPMIWEKVVCKFQNAGYRWRGGTKSNKCFICLPLVNIHITCWNDRTLSWGRSEVVGYGYKPTIPSEIFLLSLDMDKLQKIAKFM